MDAAPAPPAVPGVDRYVHVGGLRIHCYEQGAPDDPPVVVLHGIMGHTREWDTLTGELARSFHVLAVDQRGHGESDWADEYTAAAMAHDVVRLVEQVGIAPVSLVGHSLGAIVAAVVAADRPDLVSRLVLLDIGPDSLGTPEIVGEMAATLTALAGTSYAHAGEAVEQWLVGNHLADADLMRHYVEHCLVARDDGRFGWRFDGEGLVRFLTEGVTESQLWSAVDRLSAPTLLVRGEHSPLLSRATAHEMVRRLGRARFVEIPGAGHDLGVERPREVAAATLRFLTG